MTAPDSWLDDLDDDFVPGPDALDADAVERFEDRGHRLARKPPRRRSVNKLLLPLDEGGEPKFDDPGLQALAERGLILELLWELKSGKEATVYVARGPDGLVAAKLYVDPRVRSFRNDRVYRDGRFVGSDALDKAIQVRSRTGVNAQHHLWVQEEFRQLQALSAYGVAVPEPIACEGSVVLMEFIGSEDGPAPRLADMKLSRDEAEEAFSQCVANLALIVAS
ncbi:MAG TPA: RIO1 family regulatory kinase/ATPase, partial [Deinococcales bacterium]|nr:RIO1 family regulatory kinase/ATPase [Deinococcales bacterium]